MITSFSKRSIFIASILILTNCGGGGGGGIGDTPANTSSFSLSQLKNLTPGHSKTYNLTGGDNNGSTYEANLTVTIKNPSLIDAKMLTPAETSVYIKNTTSNAFVTGTTTAYYTTDKIFVKLVRDTGVTCTATSYNGLPDAATIGQAGTIGILDCSDGTTETGTWRIEASGNNAKLIESYTTRSFSNTIQSSEDDKFLINANGDILGLEVTFYEPPSFTLNLSGK